MYYLYRTIKTNTMSKAKYVKDFIATDPDTGGIVEMVLYKHENGGMFAMDFSFLDQCVDENTPVIPDPFASKFVKLILED